MTEAGTRPSLPEDDATRALYPMAEGCLDYFPNALAEVSKISFEGNQKHNPGQPMHWNRGKSLDHRNKIIRHTVESKPDSEQAIYHAAQAAWRALAELQQKIERVRDMPMAPGARAAEDDETLGETIARVRATEQPMERFAMNAGTGFYDLPQQMEG